MRLKITTGRPIAAAVTFIILCLSLGGCASDAAPKLPAASAPTVKAVYTKIAPNIDGKSDAVWKTAPETRVKLLETNETINLRFLYTNTSIYVKATYPDSTHDYIDRPWRFDGQKWKQIGQQDSLCLIWNINDSIRGFNARGFDILTRGLEENRHPWDIEIDGGKQATVPAWFKAQKGDFWSTGLQLPYGKAEDWVLKTGKARWSNGDWHIKLVNQHDAFTDTAPWVLNKAADWTRPIWILKPGLTLQADPYPVSADVIEVGDHVPVAGEMQPFIVYRTRQARWGGSKDDIDGAEAWRTGIWTVEMRRPLNTGHNDDISFQPKGGRAYNFSLLVRRTGSRYQPTDPVKLVFD